VGVDAWGWQHRNRVNQMRGRLAESARLFASVGWDTLVNRRFTLNQCLSRPASFCGVLVTLLEEFLAWTRRCGVGCPSIEDACGTIYLRSLPVRARMWMGGSGCRWVWVGGLEGC
jgi:hypothetical protein